MFAFLEVTTTISTKHDPGSVSHSFLDTRVSAVHETYSNSAVCLSLKVTTS